VIVPFGAEAGASLDVGLHAVEVSFNAQEEPRKTSAIDTSSAKC
jgi:hypothetical protein